MNYKDRISLQGILQTWREHNFPASSGPTTIPGAIHALGAAEEVGELAKAHIKQEQGIRGTPQEWEAKARDAVGDIVIYLMGYCSDRGWDFEAIVEVTVSEILKRDWTKYLYDGTTE